MMEKHDGLCSLFERGIYYEFYQNFAVVDLFHLTRLFHDSPQIAASSCALTIQSDPFYFIVSWPFYSTDIVSENGSSSSV